MGWMVPGEIKAWKIAVLCELFDLLRDFLQNKPVFMFFDSFFTDNSAIRRCIDLATDCIVKENIQEK
jgi:hypothetical protein